jgi:hypothetical protein
MKKILLFAVLIMSAVCLNAQKKIESQIKVGYELGTDKSKNNSFGAEYLAGYRINPNVRIGIGTGAYYCDYLYEDAGINNLTGKYYGKYRETAMYVPLFANLKVDFIKHGVSPYISFDLGYSFFVPFSDYANGNKLGIMGKSVAGVDFPLKKGKLFVESGYKYQKRSWDKLSNPDFDQAVFSVGYQF